MKYKYGDKILITNGFYKGIKGKIIEYHRNFFSYSYYIITEDLNLREIQEKDIILLNKVTKK